MLLFQPPSGISFPIFSLSFIIIMQEMELFKSSSRCMLGIWGWWKCSYREGGINVMLAIQPVSNTRVTKNHHILIASSLAAFLWNLLLHHYCSLLYYYLINC